jgi:hypothetical protein
LQLLDIDYPVIVHLGGCPALARCPFKPAPSPVAAPAAVILDTFVLLLLLLLLPPSGAGP